MCWTSYVCRFVLDGTFNDFPQDTFVVPIPSDAKQGLCTASVDSVLGHGNRAMSVQSKGNFLYSAATAQSTMDYSSSKIEEGVVESPPSRISIPLPVIRLQLRGLPQPIVTETIMVHRGVFMGRSQPCSFLNKRVCVIYSRTHLFCLRFNVFFSKFIFHVRVVQISDGGVNLPSSSYSLPLCIVRRPTPASSMPNTIFVRRTPPVYTAWEIRSLRAQTRKYHLENPPYPHRIERGAKIVRRYLESKAKEKE